VTSYLGIEQVLQGMVFLAGIRMGQTTTPAKAERFLRTLRWFAAKDASVSIAGSGDVSLRLAGGTLTARVSGSGSVTWSGEGKLGDVEVTGSGRFRKR
jgi:hypothetical protein